MLETLR